MYKVSFPHVPWQWCFMQQVMVEVNWAVHGEKKLVGQHVTVPSSGGCCCISNVAFAHIMGGGDTLIFLCRQFYKNHFSF